MMPVYACQLIYVGWERPRVFICSALKWAIYAYKYIYTHVYMCVYTQTHTYFLHIHIGKSQMSSRSCAQYSRQWHLLRKFSIFRSTHHLISLLLQPLTAGSAIPEASHREPTLLPFRKHWQKWAHHFQKQAKGGEKVVCKHPCLTWFWFKLSATSARATEWARSQRGADSSKKLIQTGSNCSRLTRRTCAGWLSQERGLLGHTKDWWPQPTTHVTPAMRGSRWVAALPSSSCSQTGLPRPTVRNLIPP